MKQTPVLIMTYIREKNTFKILEILKKANQKNIFLFNDGLLKSKDRQIHINFRKKR